MAEEFSEEMHNFNDSNISATYNKLLWNIVTVYDSERGDVYYFEYRENLGYYTECLIVDATCFAEVDEYIALFSAMGVETQTLTRVGLEGDVLIVSYC